MPWSFQQVMFLKLIPRHISLGHMTRDFSLLTYIHINSNNYFKTATLIKVDMTKFYLNNEKNQFKLSICCCVAFKKFSKAMILTFWGLIWESYKIMHTFPPKYIIQAYKQFAYNSRRVEEPPESWGPCI